MKMKYSVIKTREQYNEYTKILENLVFKGEEDKVEEEVELLTLLIEDYDNRNRKGNFDMTPIEIIQYIMEENNLKGKDLAEILGCQPSYVSLLLSYKRRLSQDHANILSKHFNLQVAALTKPYSVNRDLEVV